MVMIFTIVSAVQEFLNQARDEMIGAIKEEKERKEREAREAEEVSLLYEAGKTDQVSLCDAWVDEE